MALQPHLVALVLLSAIMHATWNALVKNSGGDRFLTMVFVVGVGTVFGIPLIPFIPLPHPDSWPYLIASTLLHNGYYVILILTYRVGDLSQVYPLARGTAPLLVALLAAYFAGETMGYGGIAGVALVSVGIVSLMFVGGVPRGDAQKPIFLALGTSVFIGAYTVVDGLGMRLAGPPLGYILWLNILEGFPFIIAAYFLRHRHNVAGFFQRRWKTGLAGGILAIVAYGLVLYALSQGAMAYVVAMRETSVLFVAIIGSLILKETFGKVRIISAVVIVIGLVTLQLSG
jgi:drug/metabolite transporter (DMT)-like permease